MVFYGGFQGISLWLLAKFTLTLSKVTQLEISLVRSVFGDANDEEVFRKFIQKKKEKKKEEKLLENCEEKKCQRGMNNLKPLVKGVLCRLQGIL